MKRILCTVAALAMAISPALAQNRYGQPLPAPGAAAKTTVRLCTGRSDGVYFFAGNVVKKFAMSLNIQVVETQGSFDNLGKLVEGQCDAAFVQNDALKVYGIHDARSVSTIERAAAVYKEYVHLVCNREAKIGSIRDLTDKTVVAIGPEGSGTQQSWQGLVDANTKRYGAVQTDPRDGIRALTAVADGSDVTCMLFVGGVGSRLLKEDAKRYADKVVIVNADDADFREAQDAKGKTLYSYETIPAATYGALMPGGFFGRKDVKTVAVDSVIAVNSNWIAAHEKDYDVLLRGVTNAIPAIKQRAQPTK